jgi:hypothetical protein
MASGVVTGFVGLRAYWSHTSAAFGDIGTGEVVAVHDQLAQFSTNNIRGSFPVRGQYVAFDIINESGGAAVQASATALEIFDQYGDQA